MPAAIPLIGLGAALTASTVFGVGTLGAALIGGVITFGLGALVNQKPDLGSRDGLRQGILANVQSPVQPIPVIYGTRRVGGTRVFVETTGTDNNELHMVFVWCEGEINQITATYFDDIPSTDPRFVKGGRNKFRLKHYYGSDDQTADADLIAATSKWTSEHRLRGLAYTYVTLYYDTDVWAQGIPTVTVDIQGRKLDVPGIGELFTNNPAYCIRDYLVNDRYGRGISTDDIDEDSFSLAALYCATNVLVPDGEGGTDSQARHTCDGVLDTDATTLKNLAELLTSCRGMLVYTGGKYRLVIDKPETPIYTLDESRIVGAFGIAGDTKQNRFNRIRVQFFNPDSNYRQDSRTVQSASFLAADNGQILENQILLPFTTNSYRAQQIAGMELRQSRYQTVVDIVTTIEGVRFEVGDVIQLTHETPGWTEKAFRVVGLELRGNDEVGVKLLEYNDEVYDLESLNEEQPVSDVNLPNPLEDIPPTNLALATTAEVAQDGTTRTVIEATWTPPDDAFVAGIDVSYQRVGFGTKATIVKLAADTDAFVFDAVLAAQYVVRVRSVRRLGNKSSWVTSGIFAGAEEGPPDDPTNFTAQGRLGSVLLTWDLPTEVDYNATEIWRSETNDRTTSTQIATVGGNRWLDSPGPVVSHYYWIRHVDREGNQSGFTPASATAGESANERSGQPYFADPDFTEDNTVAITNNATGSMTQSYVDSDGRYWRLTQAATGGGSWTITAERRLGPDEFDAVQDANTDLTISIELEGRVSAGFDASFTLFTEWYSADEAVTTDNDTIGGPTGFGTTTGWQDNTWQTIRATQSILPAGVDPLATSAAYPHYLRFYLRAGGSTATGTLDIRRLSITPPVT